MLALSLFICATKRLIHEGSTIRCGMVLASVAEALVRWDLFPPIPSFCHAIGPLDRRLDAQQGDLRRFDSSTALFQFNQAASRGR